jgi:dTDP-4-dehydrorhamnose reductase
VLWERHSSGGRHEADWRYADESIREIFRLGMRPILGLVHHGSGPADTNLLDPEFGPKLAQYARAVAERYPEADLYTPVNEPLTTARFSAMYGHWYPHARTAKAFAQAMVNQIRGVILAMREIRKVNPQAKLVQTEDLGKTYSTASLTYQADYENLRRWLTWDLLSARVTPEHPMWGWLVGEGLDPNELEWLLDNPCPPDILGMNYYITSERFLDHRVERYPDRVHGGNGRDRYADVEAVRVLADGIAGPGRLLAEAYDRYGLPVAITEAHLGCTREEQMRWLTYVHSEALEARSAGAEVAALAVWSLQGAFDWCHLLCDDRGDYEPGVFDLRAPEPRATALTGVIRQLASVGHADHPVLTVPGWWLRSSRLEFPPVLLAEREAPRREPEGLRGVSRPRPILITGARGTLGRAFARLCEMRGLPYRLLSRQEMDICRPDSVDEVVADLQPWAIVNAAGYVRVDDAERESTRCFGENATGPALLAQAAARAGARLLSFSSDLVFDGEATEPYVESSPTRPLNVYGRSKRESEIRVLEAHEDSLVVRTSAFFGPWDEYNFLHFALSAVGRGEIFEAPEDAIVSPTYVPDLVNACLDLLIDGERGIWHLCNDGVISWSDFAREAICRAGLNDSLVRPRPSREFGWPAPRPRYSAMRSERGWVMPTLDDAIDRYLEAVETREAQVEVATRYVL